MASTKTVEENNEEARKIVEAITERTRGYSGALMVAFFEQHYKIAQGNLNILEVNVKNSTDRDLLFKSLSVTYMSLDFLKYIIERTTERLQPPGTVPSLILEFPPTITLDIVKGLMGKCGPLIKRQRDAEMALAEAGIFVDRTIIAISQHKPLRF